MSAPTLRDAASTTLTIDGRQYSNDRAGKRQAILDGLTALQPLTIGDDIYLPQEAALQLVASILYPAGITTAEAYETVCQVTTRAVAHLGFGAEETLSPPQVAFAQRGIYYKRLPAIDPQRIATELANAGTSSRAPRRELSVRLLWNQIAWERHGRALNDLPPTQAEQIGSAVDAIVTTLCWHKDETDDVRTAVYWQALTPDVTGARAAVERYLAKHNDGEIYRPTLKRIVQTAAYGRDFYNERLPDELETAIAPLLTAAGFALDAASDVYKARPLTIDPAATEALTTALTNLPVYDGDAGPMLRFDEVIEAIKQATQLETLTTWQAEPLLTEGVVGDILAERGYRRELSWRLPWQFNPPLEGRQHQAVILRRLRISRDPARGVRLDKGLRVLTPAAVLDADGETVVYLELLGNKQAVRANWAALVGRKMQYIGRQRIRLDGMKEHVQVQTTLPCGWLHLALIHKQASLSAMSPDAPFYLLDDGTTPVPPLFYPLLNKALAAPVLPAWTDYLWQQGQQHDLVQLLNDGEGQAYAAWRVLTDDEAWHQLIQTGIRQEALKLTEKGDDDREG